MPYRGWRSFLTYPGLQSCHPYGISVLCEEGTEAGEEKVEGAVNNFDFRVLILDLANQKKGVL
jgi:hypothetical protein